MNLGFQHDANCKQKLKPKQRDKAKNYKIMQAQQ